MSKEFIREVDEDLRHQQLKRLWEKYGSYLIAFLAGTVLFVAGNVTLKNYNESKYEEIADQYSAIESSLSQSNTDDALKKLEDLSGANVAGYQLLADFKLADLELTRGNKKKAVIALDKIVNSSSIDKYYRDLANYKAAMISLDTVSLDAIKLRLTPLIEEGNPWKYMAKELLAIATLSKGNNGEAKNMFTELEQDLEAPKDVKDRAKNFKSVIE